MPNILVIGVLALQGAFEEHLALLKQASARNWDEWRFIEVRTSAELDTCDGLIIPGGESTTVSLVAARSGLLEPLREFVKVKRKPTWGTCAGLILLAESANRTKKGGQELIGGLDIRVNRNHFGRQTESFETELDLPFFGDINLGSDEGARQPFNGVFIRAPVVEQILSVKEGEQSQENKRDNTVIAPSKEAQVPCFAMQPVKVMGRLPGRRQINEGSQLDGTPPELEETGEIVAVMQGNVFGTSFHPELTADARIHAWWLTEIRERFR